MRLMLQEFRSLGFPKIQIPNLFSSTSKSFPHFLALFFSTYIFYLISTLQERLRPAFVYFIKVFHGEHGEIYCGFWLIYYLDYCYLYFLKLSKVLKYSNRSIMTYTDSFKSRFSYL